jgi:dipeptidyl aminopeptidase/acylaminoacyl peptidase
MLALPRLSALSLAVLFSFSLSGRGTQRPLSIDEALSMNQVGRAVISPDGSRIVYTVSQWEWPSGKPEADKGEKPPEMHSHVWMVRTDGSEPARQLTFSERGESMPDWSPDGKMISFLSARNKGPVPEGQPVPAQIWVMSTDGGEAWKLTDAKEAVTQYHWSHDGKKIAYLSRNALSKEAEEQHKRKDDARIFEGDFQQAHIWIIDVAAKKASQITDGTDFTVESFSWSPDGTRIAFAAKPTPLLRDYRGDISIVDVASRQIEKIAVTDANETAPAWSPDGKAIAYEAVANKPGPNSDKIPFQPIGNGHLMLYDVETKKARDASGPSFDLSVGQGVWSPDSKRIYFDVGHRVWHDIYAYDVTEQKFVPITQQKLASFGGFDNSGQKVSFTMGSDSAPTDVYVADAALSDPRKLTNANPQTAEFALGNSEVIRWKSSDGQEVEGILLKPVGFAAGHKYPLLVEVHGGPTGAHSEQLNASGQFWAGQGWAVLYPNPRGSSNYGEKFAMANITDWGGGDYHDIMSGVDAVVARGIADPDKLAVAGWSYGGYMTCWIVSQTGKFKAAMMGAGLSDLVSMYGTTDIPNYIGTFFQGRPTKQNLSMYVAKSGITYVDQVTTPVLILQGAEDQRVPIGQSMEFYRALKDRGKTAELVFYPREGHGLTEFYHQRDRLKREYEWITKYTLGTSVPAGVNASSNATEPKSLP